MVDALAQDAEEGRGSLRKVSGSWQTSVIIRECPNGETPSSQLIARVSYYELAGGSWYEFIVPEKGTQGSETS